MPVWELNTLLQQVNRYLPHVLYGVHAVEAEKNQPQTVNDAALLPGMMVEGG